VAVARQQGQLLLGGIGQRALVAKDDRQAARAHDLTRAAQRYPERVAVGSGLGVQRLIDPHQPVQQLQQALLAASGFDFVVLVVTEHQPADAIVVPQRGPSHQRRGLRGEHRFEHQPGAEKQTPALFDHDEDRPLAFFMEQFGVGLLRACGDAPVDGPDVVARLVHPDLIEVDAAPAQFGVVQTNQRAALAGGRKQLHFTHAMPHLDQLGKADADARLGDQDDAVAQDVEDHRLDVFGTDEVASCQPGMGAGAAAENFLACSEDSLLANPALRLGFAVECFTTGLLENLAFDGCVRKADLDVHEEAVELGLWQRVGAFLLDRVLCRHHQKQRRQVVSAAPDADLALGHGFQQRRLHLGRRAIDLVRQHQVMEDGALLEHEAAGFGAVDFGAGDVGGQQVGGELDAVELGFDAFGQLFDRLGLGQTGCAFDQHVAVGQQRDQQALNQFLLPEDLGGEKARDWAKTRTVLHLCHWAPVVDRLSVDLADVGADVLEDDSQRGVQLGQFVGGRAVGDVVGRVAAQGFGIAGVDFHQQPSGAEGDGDVVFDVDGVVTKGNIDLILGRWDFASPARDLLKIAFVRRPDYRVAPDPTRDAERHRMHTHAERGDDQAAATVLRATGQASSRLKPVLLKATRTPVGPASAGKLLLLICIHKESKRHQTRLWCRLNGGLVEWAEPHGCGESCPPAMDGGWQRAHGARQE
nr:hypothetical protein [Tanacetum cinerariifolium]